MKKNCIFLIILLCVISFAASLSLLQAATGDAKPKVLKGPAKAPLGKYAQLDLPEGYVFLDGETYRKMLKAEGEPVSGQEIGFLKATNSDWAVAMEFAEIGYVKDDDKDKLDADKLLDSIKRGTEEANKQRVKAGNPPIKVVGWEVPPHYDSQTHNLEWAIRGECEGRPILNLNTRLLGRKGVMEVVLIVEPDKLKESLPRFRQLLTGYSFQTGQSYAEFREGDKVAKYGLGALIVGGAAVGAAKLGLFAWLAVLFKKAGKILILALIAVAASFKKLWGAITGGTRSNRGAGPLS